MLDRSVIHHKNHRVVSVVYCRKNRTRFFRSLRWHRPTTTMMMKVSCVGLIRVMTSNEFQVSYLVTSVYPACLVHESTVIYAENQEVTARYVHYLLALYVACRVFLFVHLSLALDDKK
jgi:hypothetical protein